MDCTEARTRLDAYFDQELDLPNAVAIDQHLASCPDCRASLAMRSTLRSSLREHADYRRAAPEGLGERVRARSELATSTR